MVPGFVPALRWTLDHGWVVSLALGAVVYVLRGLVRVGRGSWRDRQRAAATLRALGEPQRRWGASGEGGPTTLRGVLRAESGVARLHGDSVVAAVSVRALASGGRATGLSETSALHHRVPELVLEVDERRVELVGDVEVLVGSRTTETRGRLRRLDALVRSTISDAARIRADWDLMLPHRGQIASVEAGDEVLVRGVLELRREQDHHGTYRARASRWCLVGEEADRPLRLAHAHRTRGGGTPLVVVPSLAMILGMSTPAALGMVLTADYEGALRAAARACRVSFYDCDSEGRCSARLGDTWPLSFECVAAREADCRSTHGCSEDGRCSVVDGRCAPARDADCAQSGQCKGELKRCTLDAASGPPGGRCVSGEEDCARSGVCERLGWCTSVEGECKGTDSASCAQSVLCREHQRCVFRDGECHADASVCRASELCSERGRCAYDAEKDACIADREEDCRRSSGCARAGACQLLAGGCHARTDEDCAHSEQCREIGTCARHEYKLWCVAGADDHCARSRRCETEGRCQRVGGACFSPEALKKRCLESSECREHGKCVPSGDQCVAARNE